MQPLIKQLGYAGLLPFIGLNALTFIDILPQSLVYLYFTQYSAVLLSFFGGVHWYDAISSNKPAHQMYVAMLPTIVGWICLTQTGAPWVLGVLSISYLLMMFYPAKRNGCGLYQTAYAVNHSSGVISRSDDFQPLSANN